MSEKGHLILLILSHASHLTLRTLPGKRIPKYTYERIAANVLAILAHGQPNADYDKDTEVSIRDMQEAAAIDLSEVVEATKNDEEV